MYEYILKLKKILFREDKKNFLLLVLFSIIVSIIEIIGITAIMPFMAVSMDFNLIYSNEYLNTIFVLFQFEDEVNFIIFLGIVLILYYIFRSITNILYTYSMSKFSQAQYNLIVNRLFQTYMRMRYIDFVKKNSSFLSKSIITESNNMANGIASLLLMISEIFIVVCIYSIMLIVNYKVTFLVTLFLFVNILIMLKTISPKMKNNGVKREKVHRDFYEIINRSFQNFKLIKLQHNDNFVLNDFQNASSSYTRINVLFRTLLQVPKLFLEAVAFSLIILIIIYLIWYYRDDAVSVLSILSLFVLALYRLTPSVNRILSSYNEILYIQKSVDIVFDGLHFNYEKLGNKSITFNNDIKINNINFCYEDNKNVLSNVSLTISKGSKIAFVGESGSGKSTLVDIIIGLYSPKSGTLQVDNDIIAKENVKSWRSKIGYIPQSVYLFDGTVGENIVFGNTFDEKKLINCMKQAKIYDFLMTKNGFNTFVGEGGIMLSGGQKQRIAIARALYLEPQVLVLDEATSALDDDTEKQIMDEIYKLSEDKTLIIIAHRLSTIGNCDFVYELRNGELVNV